MTTEDIATELNKIEYAAQMERIICLDNVPTSLTIYNKFGQVKNYISLNSKKHLNYTRIISFSYSK